MRYIYELCRKFVSKADELAQYRESSRSRVNRKRITLLKEELKVVLENLKNELDK